MLKRDKIAKIARLSGCKNFVSEREVYSMRGTAVFRAVLFRLTL